MQETLDPPYVLAFCDDLRLLREKDPLVTSLFTSCMYLTNTIDQAIPSAARQRYTPDFPHFHGCEDIFHGSYPAPVWSSGCFRNPLSAAVENSRCNRTLNIYPRKTFIALETVFPIIAFASSRWISEKRSGNGHMDHPQRPSRSMPHKHDIVHARNTERFQIVGSELLTPSG